MSRLFALLIKVSFAVCFAFGAAFVFALGFAFSFPSTASAQYQQRSWLHLNYTFTEFQYQEHERVTEKAQLAGVRGELGLNLLDFLAISAGGEYQDGQTEFDGTTLKGNKVKQLTSDYISDTRALVHLIYAPIVISAGVGERFWSSNLVGQYHRSTRITYAPVQFSYFMGRGYLTVEQDLWRSGQSRNALTDAGSPRDVEFKLGKGEGFGVELGYFVPGALFATRLFARFHKWSVKASDVQNDGLNNLSLPDNTTSLIEGGIGVAF